MDHRQLTRIKVDGFKSIESADIELNMVNVLIGSNGSGKTNFILGTMAIGSRSCQLPIINS